MSDDARQIIFEEISGKIPGSKSLAGDTYMIVCPFHPDNNPSCGVNLAEGSEIPLGYFHCFGCGTKGPWNKLAQELGLTQFKEWQLSFEGNGRSRANRKEKSVTYESKAQELRRSIKTNESVPWPKNTSWRGYDGALISKLGGLMYNDPMTNQIMLYFPISVNRRYMGGVRAYTERQANGLNYLTTKGSWVKNSGLLGYEYVKHIVRKYGYRSIVLVEGPRDVLRLLENKIPALAVLGSENFSRKKLLRIMALSSKLECIYTLPDNDKGGDKMHKRVKAAAEGLIQVKRLKLPKEKDAEGKLIKMDPDDAPIGIINAVKKLVEQTRKAA